MACVTIHAQRTTKEPRRMSLGRTFSENENYGDGWGWMWDYAKDVTYTGWTIVWDARGLSRGTQSPT